MQKTMTSSSTLEIDSFEISGWHFVENIWIETAKPTSFEETIKKYVLQKKWDSKCISTSINEALDETSKNLIECDLNGGYLDHKQVDDTYLDVLFDANKINFKDTLFCSTISDKSPNYSTVEAQALLIRPILSNSKYIYISMSSYRFWNDSTLEELVESFDSINLGGSIIKIGDFDIIDKKFDFALKKD